MNKFIHSAVSSFRVLSFALFLVTSSSTLHASELDDLKKMLAIQQADIQGLKLALTESKKEMTQVKGEFAKARGELARLSSEIEATKKTMASDYQTNASSSTVFNALTERLSGLSCNAERCTFSKPIMIDFGSPDFNIHIPESWGSKQPFVVCSKTKSHCEALLSWPK